MTTLAELAGRSPDEVAVECGSVALTWAALDERTARFANALKALGACPGEHVAIQVSNRVEFIDAAIGSWRGGYIYTPLKTGWTTREIGFVIEEARTRVMVTDRDAGRQAGLDPRLVLVDVDSGYEPWLAAQDATPPDDSLCGWKLPFTSGTTGQPKGVVLTTSGQGTFSDSWRGLARYAEMLQLPGEGVHLFLARLFNGAPLTFGLGALARGARLRILPAWDAQAALDALCRDDVTSTIAVPTMFRQFLALDRQSPGSGLRTILHGGEPCPPSVKHSMLDWFGPVLVEYYGFTEGGMTITTSSEWLARPGTVGLPMAGLSVRILGPEGEVLPAGSVGAIAFVQQDGKRRFTYLNDSQKTEAAHHDDAFTVGDQGWLDDDGYLFVAGRSDDLILVAGVNVYPAEVEEALAHVSGIEDLGVVGVPDEIKGERVVLVVSLAPGATEEAVRSCIEEAAAARLAPYKRPAETVVASSIPRDETGKLLRSRLRGSLCPSLHLIDGTEGTPRGA